MPVYQMNTAAKNIMNEWMNECYAQLGMTPALYSDPGSKSQSRNQLSSMASCGLPQSHQVNSTTGLQIRPSTFPITSIIHLHSSM